MSVSNPSIIETRRDQILPLLDATDIERAWRFGEVRRFATGEALAAIGEVGVGLGIILNGQVDVPLSGYLVRIYGPTAAKH